MSLNIFDIIERIKKFKGLNSDADVSRELGFKERRGLQYYKSDGPIPYGYLIDFAQKENISLDWLLMGFGSMLRTEIDGNTPSYVADSALSSDDRQSIALLMAILKSNDQDTILAIKQNLKQFQKLVSKESNDFKTQGTKGKKLGGTAK